jgi:hypothetical protein
LTVRNLNGSVDLILSRGRSRHSRFWSLLFFKFRSLHAFTDSLDLLKRRAQIL